MGPRGPNWKEEEEEVLLDIMEDILPINPTEWETVLLNHQQSFPRRTLASIQRRFNELVRTTEPTGDPNIPRSVRRAKTIRDMIVEKTDGTTGSPEGEEQLDSDNDAEIVNANNDSFEERGDELVNFFNPGQGQLDAGAVAGRRAGGGNGEGNSRRASTVVVAGVSASTPTAANATASSSFESSSVNIPHRASPKFGNSLDLMKRGGGYSSGRKGEEFSMQNIFGMMMMSQQSDRQMNRERHEMEREMEHEKYALQMEQWRIEREERAREAREASNNQQQLMTMMMMSMFGMKKKSICPTVTTMKTINPTKDAASSMGWENMIAVPRRDMTA